MFQFEKVFYSNTEGNDNHWIDFLARFPRDWPFHEVERIQGLNHPEASIAVLPTALETRLVSYRAILEHCLLSNVDSCLVLASDTVFCDRFSARIKDFMGSLPDDWEMIYLGGQHTGVETLPPMRIKPSVFTPFRVQQSRAFAIRGRDMMLAVYNQVANTRSPGGDAPVVSHSGELHQGFDRAVYCPNEWLTGNVSQDDGKEPSSTQFHTAADDFSMVEQDVVFVVGLHRSGSSCLAMMLHKLGIHMGKRIMGWEDIRGGGGEGAGLLKICEQTMPFPATTINCSQGRILARLLDWIRKRELEAKQLGTIVGAKYPHMCLFASFLEPALKGRMKVIHISRPLQESIDSLILRDQQYSPDVLSGLQTFLWEQKQTFLKTTKAPVLHIEYTDVLDHSADVVQRIVDFLNINPTPEQLTDAIAHPNPAHRHVFSGSNKGLVHTKQQDRAAGDQRQEDK